MDMSIVLAVSIIVILFLIGEKYTTNKLYGDCKDIRCEYCSKKNSCKFDSEVIE